MADEPLELRVKAAFLFNLARFTEWPAEAFVDAQSAIVLCVREPDPLAVVLEETVADKHIDAHPLQVLRLKPGDAVARCHMLYVGGAAAAPAQQAFAATADAAIVTVHESAQALPGGVARLYLEAGRLRFEINSAAAERRHLQLSGKLLGVAVLTRL